MHRYSKIQVYLIVFSMVAFMTAANVFGHCQVPCGIYTDDMRFKMIEEHLTTIEKAMIQIEDLSKKSPVNYNQLVRWINTKEDHANQIQEIVDKYFLTQRIKPVEAGQGAEFSAYQQKVVVLHQMLVFAMKTKQGTDVANVEKLKSLLGEFHKLYFGETEKKHMESHH